MNNTTKSVFVTIVAWIFIIITGFTTLISILQNIMLQVIFNQEEMELAIANQPENMPSIFNFMAQNMELFFMGFLMVSAFAFIS